MPSPAPDLAPQCAQHLFFPLQSCLAPPPGHTPLEGHCICPGHNWGGLAFGSHFMILLPFEGVGVGCRGCRGGVGEGCVGASTPEI